MRLLPKHNYYTVAILAHPVVLDCVVGLGDIDCMQYSLGACCHNGACNCSACHCSLVYGEIHHYSIGVTGPLIKLVLLQL